MNKLFLSFLMILIVSIGHCSAVTVINSRYSSSLIPGGQDSFTMTMKPDTPSEVGILLTVSMDSGNCSSWISLDKQGVKLVTGGTPVKASISVPKDAFNGLHRCYVRYDAPPSGMVQSRIAVPFTITVIGGKDAPIPVVTTIPTATITPEITLKALPIEAVLVPGVAQVQPVSGAEPQIPYLWIAGGILAMAFVITIVYDWRRKL